ncbi:MAG: EAL domain-containing protein, partial [Bacillota bacterium]
AAGRHAGQERPLARWRVNPILVLCVGSVVSLSLFSVARHQEQKRIDQGFALAASDHVESLKDRMEEGIVALRTLVSFYAASPHMTRQGFREFVTPLLAWRSDIHALEWVPRITESERSQCEAEARQDGLAGYELVELNGSGQLVRAPQRAEYFAVFFAEPYQGNERALGFNNAPSGSDRWAALERARTTGEPVATEPITLVQETGTQLGFLIMAPVYRKGATLGTIADRRKHTDGFFVAVFRIGNLLETSIAMLKPAGIDVHLYDRSDPAHPRYLYSHWSRARKPSESPSVPSPAQVVRTLHAEVPVMVAGRKWSVVCIPTPESIQNARTWHPWAIFVGSMLTTGLLTGYLLTLKSQAKRAECLLEQLAASNRALAQENADRRQAEGALQESQERLQLAQQSARVGSFEWDTKSNHIVWSRRIEELYGVPRDSFSGTYEGWLKCVHPEDRRAAENDVRQSLQTGEYNSDFRVIWPDGSIHWLQARARVFYDAQGKPLRLVGVNVDITDRKAMEEELRTAARVDKLTGLPNRVLLSDRLQQMILRRTRVKDFNFAVLFLDLDRFKLINDSLGHDVGDQLLIEIAHRLQNELRATDSISHDVSGHTAARLGGDEFVVLLNDLRSTSDAQVVAERLLGALAKPYQLGEHTIYSIASVGMVTSDHAYTRAEDAIRDADTAMYEAKLAGKGRIVAFDASMRERAQMRLMLETELRKALEAGQFLLHYQPIVSLETGEVESFEALVRWQHPQRGMVSPGDFIPIAEESGLIVPLGEWVMREACHQLRKWWDIQGYGNPHSISINLSRNQIILPNLVERLKSIVAEAGVDPTAIHLEITESAVMRDMESASAILREIKQIGFKIDMDDFGTGYSSLACLHQFPIDMLKIDRSFVANLTRGRDFAALVNAISMLARNLGIAVIAEGVETADQVSLLQSLECQFVQGYFFGRPMTAEESLRYRPIAPISTLSRDLSR